MHVTRMHDVEIDRYPAISTSPCVQNGRKRRPRPRPERRLACRAGESGAALEPHRPRPDAERYVHTVRDLMVPMGDIAIGIGSPLVSRREPKRSILTPRGERHLRPRRRDVHRRSNPRSDAERHPHALPAHHARSARPPLGIGGARSHRRGRGSKRVEVRCKTPTPRYTKPVVYP